MTNLRITTQVALLFTFVFLISACIPNEVIDAIRNATDNIDDRLNYRPDVNIPFDTDSEIGGFRRTNSENGIVQTLNAIMNEPIVDRSSVNWEPEQMLGVQATIRNGTQRTENGELLIREIRDTENGAYIIATGLTATGNLEGIVRADFESGGPRFSNFPRGSFEYRGNGNYRTKTKLKIPLLWNFHHDCKF